MIVSDQEMIGDHDPFTLSLLFEMKIVERTFKMLDDTGMYICGVYNYK